MISFCVHIPIDQNAPYTTETCMVNQTRAILRNQHAEHYVWARFFSLSFAASVCFFFGLANCTFCWLSIGFVWFGSCFCTLVFCSIPLDCVFRWTKNGKRKIFAAGTIICLLAILSVQWTLFTAHAFFICSYDKNWRLCFSLVLNNAQPWTTHELKIVKYQSHKQRLDTTMKTFAYMFFFSGALLLISSHFMFAAFFFLWFRACSFSLTHLLNYWLPTFGAQQFLRNICWTQK